MKRIPRELPYQAFNTLELLLPTIEPIRPGQTEQVHQLFLEISKPTSSSRKSLLHFLDVFTEALLATFQSSVPVFLLLGTQLPGGTRACESPSWSQGPTSQGPRGLLSAMSPNHFCLRHCMDARCCGEAVVPEDLVGPLWIPSLWRLFKE